MVRDLITLARFKSVMYLLMKTLSELFMFKKKGINLTLNKYLKKKNCILQGEI